MANATFNQEFRTEERGKKSMIVKNAVQIYGGMLVGVAIADGYIDLWNNVATTLFFGVAEHDVLGNTSATPPVTVRVDTSGKVLKGVPVASATQASVGQVVYCSTSNPKDLTTVATTSLAIGVLTGFRSASDCDVQLWTPAEFKAWVS